MISNRLWATVLVAVCTAISLVLASSLVHAQTTTTESVIKNWSKPGSFPFQGDYSDVCALYRDQITGEQCARAIDLEERGLGEEIFLQDGDILQVSFTVKGEHQSKVLRVNFGSEVEAKDATRRAVVYDTGRSDGLKLVRPDVCGNWSLMTIREPEPEPIRVVQESQDRERFSCWLQQRHRHSPTGEILLLSGVEVGDFCSAPHYIPGLLIEGSQLQSNGQGLVCGWYPIR